jgi:pilus assembly protein CpaC
MRIRTAIRACRFRAAAVLLAAAAAVTASGQTAASAPIRLTLGRGAVVDCGDGIARVSTSNPEAVDAVVASDSEVLFHAKALGEATLFVWSKAGERRVYEVSVEPDLEPIQRLLAKTFPGEAIRVEATRDSLALVGNASVQAVADRALALVSTTMKGAVSNLQVAPPPPERQILLRVRFAELNRSAATAFALNLLSTGAGNTLGRVTTGQTPSGGITELTGGVPASRFGTAKFSISDMLNVFAFRPDLNIGLLMSDLESQGLLQVLAEPNLVATNGKEAVFLAGGEFPIPVVQGGASAGGITIQFREFGIRLAFLSQITPNRTLRLHVKPEVSSIDPANGVTVSGFRVPALATRRIETDVELSEGQSFVIAGLLDERVTRSLSRMPGLASIPLLGALFRSRSLSKARTELVVVVTPEAAWPSDKAAPLPAMPLPFMGPLKEGKAK